MVIMLDLMLFENNLPKILTHKGMIFFNIQRVK